MGIHDKLRFTLPLFGLIAVAGAVLLITAAPPHTEGGEMKSDSMADSTFGINAQALAILAILNQQEPTFADYSETDGRYKVYIETYPWHNGREHGIALTIQHTICGKGLVIVFGECRNSDSIFVDSWEMDRLPMNGPTVADFTETAYAQREYAGYRDFNKAIGIIMDKAARFYAIAKATAKGK